MGNEIEVGALDLVEAVADAIITAGLVPNKQAQAAITAMRAYWASEGVVQADRAAACEILIPFRVPEHYRDRIMAGEWDHGKEFQTLAAHRRAAAVGIFPTDSLSREVEAEVAADEAVARMRAQPDPRDAEIARLRGLLVDPGMPAWEDARQILVVELKKAKMDACAVLVEDGQPADIPSWITLNLMAARSKEPITALANSEGK